MIDPRKSSLLAVATIPLAVLLVVLIAFWTTPEPISLLHW